MSNYIKNLIATQGWKDVEKMFTDLVTECRNQEIDESMSSEEYKIVHISNKKAGDKIQGLLSKIRLAGGTITNINRVKLRK